VVHISIAVITYFLQIIAEDISHMSKQTLYKFGVETFEDAKIILEHAKRGKTIRPRSSSSGNTKSKFYWYTLVLQVSFGQMDPVTEDLFGVHLGKEITVVLLWCQSKENLSVVLHWGNTSTSLVR